MANPKISFKSLTLCEEIRREDNGKLLFVGVYTDNVLAYKFPANLGFSFFVSAETNQEESNIEIDISIQPINGGKKNSIARAEMPLNVPSENFRDGKAKTNLWLDKLGIAFEDEAMLIVSGKLKGGRFKEIDRRAVILHPNSKHTKDS